MDNPAILAGLCFDARYHVLLPEENNVNAQVHFYYVLLSFTLSLIMMAEGLCYLSWIEQLRVYVEFDLRAVKSLFKSYFGKYPRVCDVLCLLRCFVRSGEWLMYEPKFNQCGILHIESGGDNVRATDLFANFGFCECRIRNILVKRQIEDKDSALRDQVKHAVTDRVNRYLQNNKKKEFLRIPYHLTATQERDLVAAFPELRLTCDDSAYVAHAYAAASRLCEYQIAFIKLGVRCDKLDFQCDKGQVVAGLTDIGGKYPTMLRGRGRVFTYAHLILAITTIYDHLKNC